MKRKIEEQDAFVDPSISTISKFIQTLSVVKESVIKDYKYYTLKFYYITSVESDKPDEQDTTTVICLPEELLQISKIKLEDYNVEIRDDVHSLVIEWIEEDIPYYKFINVYKMNNISSIEDIPTQRKYEKITIINQ